ncbi:Protein of unknown function [Gryllus bimaculatus]|nr:Protein of unknown function [Gryllus bimaculatus]
MVTDDASSNHSYCLPQYQRYHLQWHRQPPSPATHRPSHTLNRDMEEEGLRESWKVLHHHQGCSNRVEQMPSPDSQHAAAQQAPEPHSLLRGAASDVAMGQPSWEDGGWAVTSRWDQRNSRAGSSKTYSRSYNNACSPSCRASSSTPQKRNQKSPGTNQMRRSKRIQKRRSPYSHQ